MSITLFSKNWDKKTHEKVQTYRNITVELRSFSMHCDYCFEVDGWSVCFAWIQLSWGVFSKPREYNLQSLTPFILESLGWKRVDQSSEVRWVDPNNPNSTPSTTKYAWYVSKTRVQNRTDTVTLKLYNNDLPADPR